MKTNQADYVMSRLISAMKSTPKTEMVTISHNDLEFILSAYESERQKAEMADGIMGGRQKSIGMAINPKAAGGLAWYL